MVVISVIAVTIAIIYYGNINRAVDPRTVHIRELHKKYTLFVEKNDFGNAIETLDIIEKEYKKIGHYQGSYEIGVIYTNKAAILLTLALYHSPDEIEKESNLNVSEKLLNTGLDYYKKWKNKYEELAQVEIRNLVEDEFQNITKHRVAIIKRRVKNINLALNEMDRRLSVAYTNLGIIKRHTKKFEEAIEFYKKAIKLWEDNLTAENNLRVLLGKEPKKRNFLQKMFPRKRK